MSRFASLRPVVAALALVPLVACSGQAPVPSASPTASASAGASTQATAAATPTAEPATATPVPATPTPAATRGPAAAGTTRYDIAEAKFSLDLPEDWTSVDLTSEDLDQILSLITSQNPEMADFWTTAIETAGDGIVMVAADPASAASGFATNVNVIVTPGMIRLDSAAEASAKVVEESLGVDVELAHGTLPAGDAVVLRYSPTLGGVSYHVLQYLIPATTRYYVVTFSYGDGVEASQFVPIIQTFAFLP